MKIVFAPTHLAVRDGIPCLKNKYPEFDFDYCNSREEIPDSIVDADIFVGGLNRDLYLQAKKLKWIQSTSSGVDYFVAIPELVDSDVLLTSASGTHAGAVADSAIGMILAFTRCIRDSIFKQQRRQWDQSLRSKAVELARSTVGIIGLGNLGRQMAKRAQGFDARIIAADLYPSNKPDFVHELHGFDKLSDLLRESDYVIVTVPRTPQTTGMIGAEQIALMKPTAMLVGMSRGGIIDQGALADALLSGQLASAALDVFDPEPLPEDSELWDIENLLITSHISGGTQHEGQYVLEIFSENLDRFCQGDLPLRNQVDKQLGF